MILVTGGVCQGKAEIAKSLSRQQRKEHRDGERGRFTWSIAGWRSRSNEMINEGAEHECLNIGSGGR